MFRKEMVTRISWKNHGKIWVKVLSYRRRRQRKKPFYAFSEGKIKGKKEEEEEEEGRAGRERA